MDTCARPTAQPKHNNANTDTRATTCEGCPTEALATQSCQMRSRETTCTCVGMERRHHPRLPLRTMSVGANYPLAHACSERLHIGAFDESPRMPRSHCARKSVGAPSPKLACQRAKRLATNCNTRGPSLCGGTKVKLGDAHAPERHT